MSPPKIKLHVLNQHSKLGFLAIKGLQLNIKLKILDPFGRFIVLNRDKGLLLFKYL